MVLNLRVLRTLGRNLCALCDLNVVTKHTRSASATIALSTRRASVNDGLRRIDFRLLMFVIRRRASIRRQTIFLLDHATRRLVAFSFAVRRVNALVDRPIRHLCAATLLGPFRVLRNAVSEGCKEHVRRKAILCVYRVVRRNEGLAKRLTRNIVLRGRSVRANRKRVLLNANVGASVLTRVREAKRGVEKRVNRREGQAVRFMARLHARGHVINYRVRVVYVFEGRGTLECVAMVLIDEEDGLRCFARRLDFLRNFLNPYPNVRVDHLLLRRIVERSTRLHANTAARRGGQVSQQRVGRFLCRVCDFVRGQLGVLYSITRFRREGAAAFGVRADHDHYFGRFAKRRKETYVGVVLRRLVLCGSWCLLL